MAIPHCRIGLWRCFDGILFGFHDDPAFIAHIGKAAGEGVVIDQSVTRNGENAFENGGKEGEILLASLFQDIRADILAVNVVDAAGMARCCLDHVRTRIGEMACVEQQADGGTRTAAITGAWLAARLAVQRLIDDKRLAENPLADSVAAVSVGVFGGAELLDLAYVEDKDAEVDFNVVMTGRGQFVEVQGSGEEATFSPDQLTSLVALAQRGLREVTALQTAFLAKRLL